MKIQQQPDNLWKIPTEVLNFFLENGTIVQNGDYCYTFYPFWIEVIDQEKGHVKVHRLGEDIPEELKEAVTNQRELK